MCTHPCTCWKERDPKGLYAREASGRLELPGSRSVYEAPERADLEIDTSTLSAGRRGGEGR